MKLQKIILVLAVSASLITPQVVTTYAAEETVEHSDVLSSSENDGVTVNSDGLSSEAALASGDSTSDTVTDNPSSADSAVSSETEETTEGEDSDTAISDGNESGSDTSSDESDASEPASGTDDAADSATATDQKTVAAPAATGSTSSAASAPAASTSTASSTASDYFQPSSTFLDNREKTKYNVELPIEGIPEFITQEMIVGALKCQDETGYPASVTIAQIIQESGYGKYGPGGEDGKGLSYLAYQYNNLFGIKGTGTAGTVSMNTTEQNLDGSTYQISAGFRVYNTYTECLEDRTELLEEVYSDLLEDVTDANTFAIRIGRRWATSLSYGKDLIQVMKRYDLYRLDDLTLDEFSDMIGVFANPCPGATLTSDFGYRNAPLAGASTYHKGVDLGTGSYNIPTYAAEAGVVTFAGPSGSAGNMIVIDHGNGLVTKYMHHDKIYVEVGDTVEKGQQIGLSGTTGNSTGNHLHFQVEIDGVAVDPMPYLTAQDDTDSEEAAK